MRFETALARELPGLRGGAVVAHMCPIYAVLAAPLVRPLRIPLVLWFTHWRTSSLLRAAERASTAVTTVDDRSFPFPSSKLRAIGHGIDLAEFPCSPARAGAGRSCSRSGATRPRRGSTSWSRRFRSPDPTWSCTSAARALNDEERAHRAELEQLVGELELEGRVTDRGRRSTKRDPGAAGSARRAREQHAGGCSGQGRVRGGGRMSPGAGLQPDLRRAPRPRATVPALGSERARRPDSRAGRDELRREGSSRPAAARTGRGRALGAVVGARDPRRSADVMTDGVVLHTQKVAGISGSEAHLLQLLPDLRERGWDVRFLMLHEDEPGAWEFARRAPRARRPARRHPVEGGRRPDRVRRDHGVPRPCPPPDTPHPSRPRGRLRAARRAP